MSELEHEGAATDRPERADAAQESGTAANGETEVNVTTSPEGTEIQTTTPTPDTGEAPNKQDEDDGA
jgi:hypothetical protein